MNQKPSFKSMVIMNLVNNVPMAVVMSTASPLLAGQPIEMGNWAINVLIAFVLACVLNIVLPIPLIAQKFPKIFKLEAQSLPGAIVGNIPVNLIFVVVIGLVLTYYNVRMVPVFLFAFLGTALPLYVISFVISMLTNPLAMKLAGIK